MQMLSLTKQSAAMFSFGMSIVLAIIKTAISVISGSLSLLAEAIDSVIDILTDVVTFLAIRVAELPPDDNHHYGHARAENLGALAQTVLMAATYGWVLWQAIHRIFIQPQLPELSIWIFLIASISLIVNVIRVLTLKHAAVQYKSQALAASTVNFTNDIIRTLFVLLTLGLIALSPYIPIPLWLIERIDAITAALVALFALVAAWEYGKQAISVLMDSVPDDLSHRLTRLISELPDVVPNSAQVRARFVGDQPFVEVTVGMPRGLSLEEAHELTHNVERVIRKDLHDAQVLVHVEPTRTQTEPYTTAVYSAAQRLGHRVHNLVIYQLKEELRIEMDLELPESLTLTEAHTHSERLEQAIASEMPCLAHIAIHLEPRLDQIRPAVNYPPVLEQVDKAIATLAHAACIDQVDAFLTDEGIVVTLRCGFAGDMLLTDVHTAMACIERDLRLVLPNVVRIQIDPEPVG